MSLVITAAERGAYTTKFTVDGQERNLVQHLNDLAAAAAGGGSGVVDTVTVSNSVAEAAKSSNAFTFNSGNPPARRLYVPTLQELGYPSEGYALQAMVIAHLRSDAPPTEVVVRLSDDKGDTVPGSDVTDSVTASAVDVIIKSDVFSITGGANYAVDFRLTTNGAANVTLYNKVLLLRVVQA